jgi:hypothetical protein
MYFLTTDMGTLSVDNEFCSLVVVWSFDEMK